MKRGYAAIISAALLSFSAHALYLDSTIYEMPADKSFISKRIFNDSKKQNVYRISAVKIDKPGPGGEKRQDIEEGELIFAPLTFSLAPDAGEFFKIFYRGPQDDKERYYRVQFTELPVTMFAERNGGKEAKRYRLSPWIRYWWCAREKSTCAIPWMSRLGCLKIPGTLF